MNMGVCFENHYIKTSVAYHSFAVLYLCGSKVISWRIVKVLFRSDILHCPELLCFALRELPQFQYNSQHNTLSSQSSNTMFSGGLVVLLPWLDGSPLNIPIQGRGFPLEERRSSHSCIKSCANSWKPSPAPNVLNTWTKTAGVVCGRECGHFPLPPQKHLLSLAAAAPAKCLCQAAAVRGGMSHDQLEGKKSPSGPRS